MDRNEITRLVQLREFSRNFHESLDYRGNPIKVTLTKEVVEFTASLINSLDDILRDHVTFEGGNENS
tara:strand:+ start:1785 stop:1985 length:201 start_codon:yes stop_codon:yes gene_type:complete